MKTKLSRDLLRRIAKDAKVDPHRFIRLVRQRHMSILEAVTYIQDTDAEVLFRQRAETQWQPKVKARERRQMAANAYAADGWRLDVR
jgi:hypothetical protein